VNHTSDILIASKHRLNPTFLSQNSRGQRCVFNTTVSKLLTIPQAHSKPGLFQCLTEGLQN